MDNKANIKSIKISSNYGSSVDVAGGTTVLQLYESVFDPTIRAVASIIDTGFRSPEAVTTAGIEKKDLNLTSGEVASISVSDSGGGSLSLDLRVYDVTGLSEHTQYDTYTLHCYSKECFENEDVKNRVNIRYDGKITDYVPDIIKNNLKSSKDLKIDPCINTLSFLGHVQKPFYTLTWLAKRTVPDIAPLGDLAGYFFWETTDGYKFRSIDKIFKEKNIVRRFIFTNTTKDSSGYDAKILDYRWSENINLERKTETSAYNKSQFRSFDPYTNNYSSDDFDSTNQFNYDNIGGLEKPKVGVADNLEDRSSRLASNWLDTGVLPPGSTLGAQLPLSKNRINFDIDSILRQSYIRYNNLFNHKLTIKINGDFGIHAGDLVWVDFPEISSRVDQIISEKKGGIYMVIDVSHHITPRGCFTGLNLARESIYRPPIPPTPKVKESLLATSLQGL